MQKLASRRQKFGNFIFKVTKIGSGIIFLVFLLITIIPFSKVYAADFPVGHQSVQVEASIGQYYITLSGYIAPYASVVMVVDGVVYKSVVADSTGHFTISQVLVKEGFDHFCLDSVDVKRLGESEACLTIPPVKADYTRTDIFLPPTIGLFRTEVQVGSNAIIWGYSMPGAVVRLKFPDGTVYTATADAHGYYEIHVKLDKSGTFELFADASLQNKKSENPTKGVILKALTAAGQVSQNVGNFFKNLLTFLYNLPLGPLWLALPIIILILILLRKLLKKGVPATSAPGTAHSAFDLFRRNKKLHHAWMEGVGY